MNNFIAMEKLVQEVPKRKYELKDFLEQADKAGISALHIAANNGAYHCLDIYLKNSEVIDERAKHGISF